MLELQKLAPDLVILVSLNYRSPHEYVPVTEQDESFIVQLIDPGRRFVPSMSVEQVRSLSKDSDVIDQDADAIDQDREGQEEGM